jgi:exonuclease III
LNVINHNKNVDLSNSLCIFHQNVRGLRSKSEELIHSLETDNISEQHMEEQEVLHHTLPGYILGTSFCHKHVQGGGGGGVGIFVCKDLNVNKIYISHNCREKDLEICAVELETEAPKLTVLSLYRAPTGDFDRFIENLHDTSKYLYKPKAEFLICGDINTDYSLKPTRENNCPHY